MWINDKYRDISEGIGISTLWIKAMDKKENDIDSKELNVSLEESTLDLKSVRESRGLTLKDISFSTRVSYSNLKAIEEQKFKLLPEPIYARAFIGAYASALDIDGKKIFSLYDKYLEGLEPDENEIELLKKLARKKSHTGFWIWLAIVSCVIALIGFFLLYQWNKDDHREMKEQPPVGEIHNSSGNVSAVEKDGDVGKGEDRTLEVDGKHPEDLSAADGMKSTGSVIEEARQPEIEGEQPKEEVVSDRDVAGEGEPYALVIKASELTWIQISKDEEPLFEVMLRPGDRIREETSEKFDLIIGNAAGVNISFQGKPLGSLGKHGEVVHLTLPEDM